MSSPASDCPVNTQTRLVISFSKFGGESDLRQKDLCDLNLQSQASDAWSLNKDGLDVTYQFW
jgi:hypothetical protein